MKETVQEKRLRLTITNKNFAPKYLKNIIVDICHGQSTCAHTETCYICKKTAHTKKEKYSGQDYGVRFGRFYNKRHKRNNSPAYFTHYICCDCIRDIIKELNYKFVLSYVP